LNKFYKTLISSLLLVALFAACSEQEKPAPSSPALPNIILIMVDDMGYESLGCNGSTEYQTPNLDRIASQGIRFDHFFSQPLCTPSRVKIMTGKFNFRNYEYFGYLNPNQQTFGNLLKEAGYNTCIAGKWQLNGLNRDNPGNQDLDRPHQFGFDEYCLWQLHHRRSEGERFANPLITQNGQDLPSDEDAYGPDIFADYILDFIDRKADSSFFVYYPMVLVHDPFVPTPDSPEWLEPSRRYEHDTIYFADMVAYTDKIVDRIEQKLKEKNVWENTVLIFTADNGTHPSVITETTSGKVVGGKGNSINTGNHVPMIVSWPDQITEGRVYREMADFTDILPTLAEIGGVPADRYQTDGSSFLSVINGSNQPIKQQVFIHYTPHWGKNDNYQNRWVMNQDYKLYQDGRFFNTTQDPGERNPLTDLSPDQQQVADRFSQVLQSKDSELPYSPGQ